MRIAMADQLQQHLRPGLVAVGGVAALLRHRALGLTKDSALAVRGRARAYPTFDAAHQAFDDGPPDVAVAAGARFVVAHDCNPSVDDPITQPCEQIAYPKKSI